MVKSIIVDSSNYVSGNTFIYNFKTELVAPRDVVAISVSNMSFYNSTFNITTNNNNNSLTLNWLGTTYTITFPSGYYSITNINSFIQAFCVTNNLYMTASSGNVYFVELVTNSQRYAGQLNLYAIPTSSQATTFGYSLPSGASWSLPSTASTPQLTFNSSFGYLIGLSSGTYPTSVQTSTQSFISTFTPIISPVNSYTVCCSLINNPYSQPNNIICSAPLNASIGSLCSYQPANLVWHEIYGGRYTSMVITLYDQLNNILNINDNEFVIHLCLLSANDITTKFNGNPAVK
jgi:hypothetical protein